MRGNIPGATWYFQFWNHLPTNARSKHCHCPYILRSGSAANWPILACFLYSSNRGKIRNAKRDKKKRFRKQRRFGNHKNDLANLKQQSKKMQNKLRFRDQNKSQHTRPDPTLFHAPYPIRVAYLHLIGDVFAFDSESVILVSEAYIHLITPDVGFEINGLLVLELGNWTSWFLDGVWCWFLNVESVFQNFGTVESEFFPETSIQHHIVSKEAQAWNWMVHWHQILKRKLNSLRKRIPLCKHIAVKHALQRDFRPSARPSCLSGKYSPRWSSDSTVTTSQKCSKRPKQFPHVSAI